MTAAQLWTRRSAGQAVSVKTLTRDLWIAAGLFATLGMWEIDAVRLVLEIDGFAIDLQHKDHRLFGELAAQHNAPTPLNDLALQLYEAMQAQGLGRKDLTEAANVAADQSGLSRFDE